MKLNFRNVSIFVIFVLLIIARVLAPAILLSKVNSYLASFSETYTAHIDDFDLSILRGAYRMENFKMALKSTSEKSFATAGAIDISVAWRELFKGRIVTDVVVTDANIIASKSLIDGGVKDPNKSAKDAKDVGTTLFPVRTERIEIKNSRIEYTDYAVYIDGVDGRLSNVTPTDQNALSLLTLRGALQGKTAVKIFMTLNQTSQPTAWLLSAEVQQLNMLDANPLINRFVPLTFKQGQLNIFTEMKSEGGKISGYLKPFLKDAEVVGDDKDFKGIKHFGTEITVAFLNLFFRNGKDHTVATKVLFTYDDKFEWNMLNTLALLFKNGYQEELKPGIENLLVLSDKNNKNNFEKKEN